MIFVDWGDAARFANWLHNGQPTGAENASTTEDGAYALNGATTTAALMAVTRKAGARWWLPSENEWYKAAYYEPMTNVYVDYPTGANITPNNNKPMNDTGNSANFFATDFTNGMGLPETDAGAYVFSASRYGTYDQGGNVWELTDTVFSSANRVLRGGGYAHAVGQMHASFRTGWDPGFGDSSVGFRVAAFVPEPTTTVLAGCGLFGLLLPRRRFAWLFSRGGSINRPNRFAIPQHSLLDPRRV